MTRLHFVKKARKDNQVAKKGESYYWWKFRYGGKYYSKEKPPRSRLTQSPFFAAIWDIQDELAGKSSLTMDEALEIAARIDELRDEAEDSLYNMPDHLQDSSDTGQMLQERVDELDNWGSEIESLDFEDMTPEEILEGVLNADPGTW